MTQEPGILLPPIQMPTNIESERLVLGSIIMMNKCFVDVADIVEEWHFADGTHRKIYAVLKTMISAGRAATPVTIKDFLRSDAEFAELGGVKYLMGLCGGTAVPLWAADYARAVSDCAQRREIIGAAMDAIQDAQNGEIAAEQTAMTAVGSLTQMNGSAGGFVSLDSAIDEVIGELENPSALLCFPTRMRRLDSMLGGGLYAGKFYGIAARHKVGKTALLLSISYSLLFDRPDPVPHLYVCMEMGAKEISQRLLARHIGINSEAFLELQTKGEAYVQGQWLTRAGLADRVRQAKVEMQSRGLTFQQRPRLSLDALKATIASAAMSGKYRGIIVDYLQMVTGRKRNQSQAEHFDDVAQTLVETAKQHGMWVIAAAQLNREGLIRGGDGLLNACDMALNLNRKPDGSGGYENDGWLEMTASRFTPYRHLGTEKLPGLTLDKRVGPYFREFESTAGGDGE